MKIANKPVCVSSSRDDQSSIAEKRPRPSHNNRSFGNRFTKSLTYAVGAAAALSGLAAPASARSLNDMLVSASHHTDRMFEQQHQLARRLDVLSQQVSAGACTYGACSGELNSIRQLAYHQLHALQGHAALINGAKSELPSSR